MAFNRQFLLGTTMFAGVLLLGASGPAFAQEQAPAQPPQAPVADSENQDDGTARDEIADQAVQQATGGQDANEVEELVVTGSRIRRNEFTSAAPIAVITRETATLEGLVDTAEILQQSSVASGSYQQNTLLTGFVTTGGQNVQTVALRGLGATRTLVLLNGRRVPPAGISGTVGPVDLNVLPSSIIDRTEILKDGASSIYGSDAVAGVINVITRTQTDGLELEAYANVPVEGEGEQYNLNGVYGRVFDRGYVNVSFDYTDIQRQKRKDRDYTSCDEDYVFDPQTGQRLDIIDSRTGRFKCFDAVNGGWQAADVFGGTFFFDPTLSGAPAGGYPAAALTTRPFLPDWVRFGRGNFPATYPYGIYTHPAVDNLDTIAPVKRTTVFASGAYDLAANVEAYGELLLNRRESEGDAYQYLFEFVDPSNPNNTVAEGLQAGGASGFARPLIIFPYNASEEIDYVRVLGGLRGDLPNAPGFLSGWNYDVYAQFGRSDATYEGDFIYNDRVFATTGPDVACDPSAITISGPANCVSIPWFSDRVLRGNFTPEELAFLRGRESGSTLYEQYIFEASLTGTLFTLPAGDVGAAVGVSYRHDEIDDQPGFNAQNSNYWGFSTAGRTTGEDNVKEVYGEIEVPVVRGLPIAESLTLQLSGRYTDYESYGSDSTYKLGLNWQITPEFRLRATRGTSFRAPALYELYLANQTSFFNGIDPCERYEESNNPRIQENCAAAGVPEGYVSPSTPQIVSGGGIGRLVAETSEATTIGLIWTPEFIDLNIAVDYFDIEVNDEVDQFGGQNILNSCYAQTDFPNDFCTLFTRDPVTSDITLIIDNYVNVASQTNRGIDLTTRYEREFGFGDLTIDTQFTWQLEDVVSFLGGTPDDRNGETTEPDFTGIVNVRFDRGDWTGFWTVDMIGKASDTEAFEGDVFNSTRYAQDVYYKQYTEFTTYHAASVRRRFDDLTVQVGVQNVFDERPPAQSSGQFRQGVSALNAFDLRGRRVFARINKQF